MNINIGIKMQVSKTVGWRCLGIVLVSGLVSGLAGCAVQALPGGQLQFGVDNAEILGQTLSSFQLVDGSEGRLRVLGGKYSVKLQKQFKVVDIVNATMVRVASATDVGGRTLLVLEKSEPNCNFKTHILAIQGAEVLSWDFGDCRSQPITSIGSDQAVFDFVQGRQTTRFLYRDARLMRGDYPTGAAANAPNAPSPATADTNGRRYVPGPPVAWGNQPAVPAANSTAGASSVASVASSPTSPKVATKPAPASTIPNNTNPVASAVNAQRPAAPPSTKAMDFPVQEQKPVRIVLDK
jgi:hypothetical protein